KIQYNQLIIEQNHFRNIRAISSTILQLITFNFLHSSIILMNGEVMSSYFKKRNRIYLKMIKEITHFITVHKTNLVISNSCAPPVMPIITLVYRRHLNRKIF